MKHFPVFELGSSRQIGDYRTDDDHHHGRLLSKPSEHLLVRCPVLPCCRFARALLWTSTPTRPSPRKRSWVKIRITATLFGGVVVLRPRRMATAPIFLFFTTNAPRKDMLVCLCVLFRHSSRASRNRFSLLFFLSWLRPAMFCPFEGRRTPASHLSIYTAVLPYRFPSSFLVLFQPAATTIPACRPTCSVFFSSMSPSSHV